jgi:hypothetical protein
VTKPRKFNKQGLPILNSRGFNGRAVSKGPCEHFAFAELEIVGYRPTEDSSYLGGEPIYSRRCMHCNEIIDRN